MSNVISIPPKNDIKQIGNAEASLTPRKIVDELDSYIIGQTGAKRMVALAIRNRYRRKLLDEDLRDEVSPKNIILIGPTGVGKTEIARRLAKLVNAPFIKVEATKYTEVGYVGRDVESMVRDLVNIAVADAKEIKMKEVEAEATEIASDKLVDLIMPAMKRDKKKNGDKDLDIENIENEEENRQANKKEAAREQMKIRIKNGDFDDTYVDVKVKANSSGMMDMMPSMGFEDNDMFQNVIGSIIPQKKKLKKLKVADAKKHLIADISESMLDMEKITSEALTNTENMGIIFLDEIDKIASNDKSSSADVARHGVQRDLLPIVEGTTVNTKYGHVKTDYILFIAAGAFHTNKPSDLIPELQGRFPIRVELQALSKDDFKQILTKPKNAITKQYEQLLKTENVEINFTDGALDYIAETAYTINTNVENIGARRLYTIMEKIFEEISFSADEHSGEKIEVNEKYVEEKLKDIVKNMDVSRYIL